MSIPLPHECFKASIQRWEGGWQAMPADSGNYTPGHKLVGTMHGVTVNAYAAMKGVDPETVTPEMMQAEITWDYAADIYLRNYFQRPGISKLPWSPLSEIVADIGWGSGPVVGIRMLQRLCRVSADGIIGPITIAATSAYLARLGAADSVRALSAVRRQFYLDISEPGSKNAIFRTGWLRRADWYLPENMAWWGQWADWEMPA